MASAIVRLDKETQFQKHQATRSIGHRQYLCWGVGNITIGVHYPECHDLFVRSKTSYFKPPKWPVDLDHVEVREQPIQQPAAAVHCGCPSGCSGEPSEVPLATQRPLSQHHLYSSGQKVIMNHLKTVTTLHFVSFLFFLLLSAVSESCVLSNLRPSREDTKLGA